VEVVEAVNKKLSWIADLDSSKVNIFTLVQMMSSRKPGKYLLGDGKSNGSPYVVGVYFDETASPGRSPMQSCVIGYVNHD
jgi:hypothetical protein